MFLEGAIQHLRQFENRVLHPDRPYSLDYWLSLSRRFPDIPDLVLGGKKGQSCVRWAPAAREALARDGYGGLFTYLGAQDSGDNCLRGLGVEGYLCLISKRNRKVFVADGSAGQLFLNGEYPQGYYGYLKDAPLALQDLLCPYQI